MNDVIGMHRESNKETPYASAGKRKKSPQSPQNQ